TRRPRPRPGHRHRPPGRTDRPVTAGEGPELVLEGVADTRPRGRQASGEDNVNPMDLEIIAARSPVKPPTLADVARLAGVSTTTASRVLNGGVRVKKSGSAEVRKRVTDAARSLGYSVNPAAQTTKEGRARTVALLVSDIDDFGSSSIISGFMHAAEEREFSVAVRTTRDSPQHEVELLERLRGERHRAVIIGTTRTTDIRREAALDAQLRKREGQGTRVVLVGDSPLEYPSVTVDNRKSAFRLAEAFAGAGVRRVAIITGPDDEVTATERAEGFRDGLAAGGVEVSSDLVINAPFSRDGGFEATQALQDRLDGLELVAAMSDAMAVGAIAALRGMRWKMPEDIEVSGFDSVPVLGDLLPRFSTVGVPLEKFGEAAL